MEGPRATRERGPSFWAHGAGLLGLCALGAGGWILLEVLPAGLTRLNGQALRLALIGLGALLVAWRRGEVEREIAPLWRLGVAGSLFIAVPQLMIQIAREGVAEGSAVTLSAMVPVMIVVLAGHFADGPEAMRLIPAALAGLGGVMLIFHLESPGSARAWGFFSLAVMAAVLAAVGSVWSYRALQGVPLMMGLAVICLANAVVLGLAAKFGEPGSWRWAAMGTEVVLLFGLELPGMVLLVWLVRTVAPERLAARFLITPMLAVLLGYVSVRPALSWQAVVGAVLMAGAGWWLWAYRGAAEVERVVPR